MSKTSVEMCNSGDLISKNSIPIVSVIVATYRRSLSLERALLSLTSQEYNNLEVIVVDDNADVSWNKKVETIINNVKCQFHGQLIYVQNKENIGSAKTRNIGIKKASGEYVTFLDDDDIYLPKKVKNQVEHMIRNKSDYSITDLYLYDENDRLIERRNRQYLKKYTKDDLQRYHLMYHMTGTDTMMFKLDYLMDLGCFPLINVGDEFYLMQKAIEAGGKFSYLRSCDLKAYVHRGTSGLSSGESKINGENDLYRYKKNYFNSLPSYAKRYIKMRHYAVLAFAEYRRERYGYFFKYGMQSFFSSPVNCVRMIIQRK